MDQEALRDTLTLVCRKQPSLILDVLQSADPTRHSPGNTQDVPSWLYLYQLQGNAYCKRKCLLRKDTQQLPHNFSGKEPKINLSRDLDKISTCHDHISTCISLHVHTDILHYFFHAGFLYNCSG